MLSLIEVKCPHCGAQGQIMLPPLGAIIVGPCPCEEMVVVFCGKVLPLEKEIFVNGNAEEKREHLLEVLNLFLQERVERLFANQSGEEVSDEGEAADLEAELEEEDALEVAEAPVAQEGKRAKKPLISESEFNAFVQTDLKLIDNAAYFRAMFS